METQDLHLEFDFLDEFNFRENEIVFETHLEYKIPQDMVELFDSWGDEPVIEDFIKEYEEQELFCFTKPIYENESSSENGIIGRYKDARLKTK